MCQNLGELLIHLIVPKPRRASHLLCKSLGKKIAKRLSSSFNKKLESIMTQLPKKGMSLDKTPMVGEEDEEYEENDDEEMEVLDEDEDEDEEINDGNDSV
ncbi:hypothetical protein Tco_1309514, partial [Tanacetum coccineum]